MADTELQDLAEATSIASDDLLYLKTAAGVNRKASASLFTTWDTTVLDLTSGSWTQPFNSSLPGTWTFNAGVISQTVATADDAIQYVSYVPANTFVVEFDVRFPTGQDAGVAPVAIVAGLSPLALDGGGFSSPFAGSQLFGIGAGLLAIAPGDGTTFDPTPFLDGNVITGAGAEITLVQDAWHTVKAMCDGVLQRVYVDGEFVAVGQQVTGGNVMGGTTPGDLISSVQVAAVGLVDFRSISISTQPLP